MKKGDISVVLWFQLFRALIAVALIIAAFSFCARSEPYEKNFDLANDLISELKDKGPEYQTSGIFIFEPAKQMGVFFRGGPDDLPYAAQYIVSDWEPSITYDNGLSEFNPDPNSLRGYLLTEYLPYRVERPSSCSVSGCYCIMSGISLDREEKNLISGDEMNFKGKIFDKYYSINYEDIVCKSIDSPPASVQEINYTTEGWEKSTLNVGSGRDRTATTRAQKTNITEHVINIGGTFMAPIGGESHIFYFSPGEDGFEVCKFEDQC